MYLPQLVAYSSYVRDHCIHSTNVASSFFFLENEKVPDYKTVSIKNDVNVKDFYNVEDRLGA